MKVRMLALVILSAASLSAYAYNPAHVTQFENTNVCENCDLSNADFRIDQDPKHTNHSGASLANANLSNIFSVRMNLSEANLQGANLSGANLEEANLSYADLTGADLNGAYLYYANLYGAKNANLKNARMCSSILPNGTPTAKC